MLRLVPLLFTLLMTMPAAVQDRRIRAGTYDLDIVFGGGNLTATLDLSYKADSITVKLNFGNHESPVRAGRQSANKLTLEPKSPTLNVRYELEFNDDEVKGTFTYDGQDGQLTGKRRRADR